MNTSTLLLTTAALVTLLPMNNLQSEEPATFSGVSDTKVEKVTFDPSKWELEWEENFDGTGYPDPKHWVPEEGYVRNGEKQFYTKGRLENARLENGFLIIEARKDDWEGKPITSASLTTKGTKSFLRGRIEVRAKIPTGRGTWPAIWTLGDNIKAAGWPACGEIDILENVGYDPARIHANIHCKKYNHMKKTGKGNAFNATEPWKDFHTYAVEWYDDRLEFFFDDNRYFVFRKESDDPEAWPFAEAQYLILNLAIGGGWGGQKGIDESLLPHRFEIDYVRYYKLKEK